MNLDTAALFANARTATGYLDTPVSADTLNQLYELMKWGPTAANCCPARLVFVTSPEARAKLVACAAPNNVGKINSAPVTVIVGMDLNFPDTLAQLYPQVNAKAWYEGKPAFIAETAMRNSSLQGGYLILAARALGLDCGPMSGFNNAALDEAFFAGTAVKSNFICTLGHADKAQERPRNPRLSFEQACRIA
jgi:3-hydroxypropanoate dehydrogenase